jgi:type VI secretion system Hcp family effector
MALNAYLKLKLDGTPVNGSVTQKGRENSIEVNSLEWSFDSDGNVGEVKFVGDIDKALPVIANGLKNNQVAEGTFEFWLPSPTGAETQYFTLHGTQGKVTSVDMWMPNNQDPNLQRYNNTVQYTMTFQSMDITWVAGGISATIP